MKLTPKQAQKVIDLANAEVAKNYQLRFGQSLWNFLYQDHPDLANQYHGTNLDFFYEVDSGRVCEIFFEHYVEEGL